MSLTSAIRIGVILPKARRLPRQGQEKLENGSKTERNCPLRWQSPKLQERRSTCFERFSEIPHANFTVTPCNDLVARQINKFRSFSSLVSSFLWQIQNVLLKPVYQKVTSFQKQQKTGIDGALLVMLEQLY